MFHFSLSSLLLINAFTTVYCLAGGLIGRVQSSGARGTLTCNGRPASHVLVKLYDDDRGPFEIILKHTFSRCKNL